MSVNLVLRFPKAYSLFQRSIRASRLRNTLVESFILPKENQRVLDIGCGTAEIADYLAPYKVEYFGIDGSPRYVKACQKRHSKNPRHHFLCGVIREDAPIATESLGAHSFDCVLAIGVIHHLSDSETLELLKSVSFYLRPGGRFVAMDPCRYPRMSLIAQAVVNSDRGNFIRTYTEYEKLASPFFKSLRMVEERNPVILPGHCIFTVGEDAA